MAQDFIYIWIKSMECMYYFKISKGPEKLELAIGECSGL